MASAASCVCLGTQCPLMQTLGVLSWWPAQLVYIQTGHSLDITVTTLITFTTAYTSPTLAQQKSDKWALPDPTLSSRSLIYWYLSFNPCPTVSLLLQQPWVAFRKSSPFSGNTLLRNNSISDRIGRNFSLANDIRKASQLITRLVSSFRLFYLFLYSDFLSKFRPIHTTTLPSPDQTKGRIQFLTLFLSFTSFFLP